MELFSWPSKKPEERESPNTLVLGGRMRGFPVLTFTKKVTGTAKPHCVLFLLSLSVKSNSSARRISVLILVTECSLPDCRIADWASSELLSKCVVKFVFSQQKPSKFTVKLFSPNCVDPQIETERGEAWGRCLGEVNQFLRVTTKHYGLGAYEWQKCVSQHSTDWTSEKEPLWLGSGEGPLPSCSLHVSS